ncbi:hypothetical protein HQ571_05615 [Candidatus Kuenenbacteria bacterium]|nr:hypothetical protein [Candidatus Kuenenbacteria bacterium]
MRQRRLIENTSPCSFDYYDKSLQTIADAKAKGQVKCSNVQQCNARNVLEEIQCTRRLAQEIASYIIDRPEPYPEAVRRERLDLINCPMEGNFWVFRNGEWEIVRGSENVIDDIIDFVEIIIDFQFDEKSQSKRGMEKSHLSLTR